ncbi:MAG TPA: glycine--tRNA ligase subunit beta, partial [Candidatus Avacidaminococcus intestinavium]|nr:glycine--tRNA ligase subunit beta [Candidatus Avacidaminococcus intestinavium]
MKNTLLFEIGTEEIPAKFMPGIIKQMKALAGDGLQKARIPFGKLNVFATPRRITLVVNEVAAEQESSVVENKGPSIKIAFAEDGTYTKAAQGFAKGQGIAVESLVVRDNYVYAIKELAGHEVFALLPAFLQELVETLTFPKTMHWGEQDFRFVRPIRWLMALLGGQVVPVTIAGVKSGNSTRGHRFLSNGDIVIEDADQYESVLREHFVIINQEEREQIIRKQVTEVALKEGGRVEIDEELLEEVTYLVEYPTALCGHFDEKFLTLPKEAIITPMREHQRYFPVVNAKGELLNKFITVRNGGDYALNTVAHGNERVLRARLSDAEFFFNEDCRVTLESRLEKLKTIVFQEGLGNIYDKTMRISALALFLGNELNVAVDHEHLKRAALLAKTDLVTGMVCEFTELQGIMGREYALREGEAPAVANGIYEHYLPRFAGDDLPSNAIGALLSIADKIDNIVATFSRGLIPTGSQDPYALRRQAIGIINILLASNYHLNLPKLLRYVLDLLKVDGTNARALETQIKEFFLQRVKNMMGEENIRYDVIDAVIAGEENSDLTDLFARANALSAYLATKNAENTIQMFTRVFNITKKAEEGGIIKEELFVDATEQKLYAVVIDVQKQALPLLVAYEYEAVLLLMNNLTEPVNHFFEAVMVMDKNEEIKNNRLALLLQV